MTDPYQQRLEVGEAMFRDLLRQFEGLGLGIEYMGEDEDGDPCLAVVVYEDMPRVQ